MNNYRCPAVDGSDVIEILRHGEHLVIEKMRLAEGFVPNDLLLILTGPQVPDHHGARTWPANPPTSGRWRSSSSWRRWEASSRPQEAQIGVVDRVFTRVGAADTSPRGQSTFMVEMNETANILNNATRGAS